MHGCWLGCLAAALAQNPNAPPVPNPAAEEMKTVASVVARVDNKAILLQDAIGPVKATLEQMRRQLPAEEYKRQERAILKAQTDRLIDRAVLLLEVEAKLKDADRIREIRRMIGKDFEKNLAEFARKQGMKSKDEVLKQLEREGTSFEQQRVEFVDNILSTEFLRQNVQSKIVDPSREDLLAYYKEHGDDYRQNAGVVWRHIEVKIGANPKDAADKAAKVMQRLQAGEDFGKVAKEMSEDASAVNGGLCPKTSKGSYADENVDQALFTMPVGRFSAPIRGRASFHIVKVESRTADGVKPFADVQGEILVRLKDKQAADVKRQKLNELRRKHYIESVFDRVDATAAAPTKGGAQVR